MTEQNVVEQAEAELVEKHEGLAVALVLHLGDGRSAADASDGAKEVDEALEAVHLLLRTVGLELGLEAEATLVYLRVIVRVLFIGVPDQLHVLRQHVQVHLQLVEHVKGEVRFKNQEAAHLRVLDLQLFDDDLAETTLEVGALVHLLFLEELEEDEHG